MKKTLFIVLVFNILLCNAQKKEPIAGTVILYMSKHGTTEKIAGMIRDSLKDDKITVINLKNRRNPDISKCEMVLIGGSFHVGKIQKRLKNFCLRNEELLLTKTVGIFVSAMFTGDELMKEFNNAFSEKLRNHAKAIGFMGYEIYFEKMDPVTRKIMHKLTGEKQDIFKINYDNIKTFISDIRR
jgi:menaquinone-dependent protoporphyrinogen oxidase